MRTTPINHIHVSQRGGFGRVALSATQVHVPALGYVIDYKELFLTLSQAAAATACTYREGSRALALAREGDAWRISYTCDGATASLSAPVVVVADGGDIAGLAPPKIIDYAQHALTARVSAALPHENRAYERFTPEGPLALLPYEQDMSLVWTLAPARAALLKAASPTDFCAALREAFGSRLGPFKSVTQRACFPLSLRYAATATTAVPGVITIGNAAQTLHPVAGQGFNLGLRDAWELAQALRGSPGTAPQALTNHSLPRDYAARRRVDRNATIAVTHSLAHLFTPDFLPLRALRGAGLTLLGSIAPLRNAAARRMIFGARG